MYRGEIYYADLSPTKGSEQGGLRPVLIIQNDVGNKYSPTTIVAPLTSQMGKKPLPTHIILDNWVGTKSVILLEQVRVIDKSRLEKKPIYRLDDMREVDKALMISLGLAATEV